MISAILIIKNEIKNLPECLDSIKWCDEIVIVDCFSTDGSFEFAKDFGARVFLEDWKGYGAQKNSALLKAKGGWILSIDADERVSPPLKDEILEIIRQRSKYDGYYIPRKNYFRNRWIKHGGWYPDYTLRLFKKGKGVFDERLVHERILLKGDVGYLKSPLIHYTYRSVSDLVIRMEKYSRLSLAEMEKTKRSKSFLAGLLHSIYTFIHMYFLRLGFLDGDDGLFLAFSYSYYTLLKYYRFSKKDSVCPDLLRY